jgi:hypothetical protein
MWTSGTGVVAQLVAKHEHVVLECPLGHRTSAKTCPCELIKKHPGRRVPFKENTVDIKQYMCERCARGWK